MPNGRCRMHGGKSPGAPKGERNGNYRHGRETKEARQRAKESHARVQALLQLGNSIGMFGPFKPKREGI